MTDDKTNLPIRIAALYQFARFDDPAAIKPDLLAAMETAGVRGTLLLAREGVNGTIAGSDEGTEAVLDHVRGLPGCAEIEVKESRAAAMPFHRTKVRLKKEIVTMGQPDLDPLDGVGTYVAPEDWNALISDPDTILIDTRNDYEVQIGSFEGAIDPETKSFREFPEWFRAKRAEIESEGRSAKIAMFCTGGIRCEKSTAFARAEGVDEVYHLKGGILNYLEHVPEGDSLWRGECFVFDERVSVGHGLEVGEHSLCRACRRPLSEADLTHEHYVEGVSCHRCQGERSEEQRARYAERQRQELLAEARGAEHVGRRGEAEADG
ncbi:rhodanese-related sulfurtransferase [Erythrobacter sp.]|uniref:oxygen-dependent tRNA uridine(34) hydroxylase TrhO n=1 Tax=Erythrobacter sp. TaxID=1042 RepID=UPI001B2D2524|nr:rhodanese-related sulfurtransferase [Erythrobacter sp.]MBO6525806.1 rhodanese-related sulfurtransferase [Erythrobacter sp.]MBO6529519.1 rhodanese-related sulfurtransferase [Erythrobacter sp.]